MLQFIVNDKIAKFAMGFLKHLFWKVRLKLYFSTTFHPQTNSQIERVNKVLNQCFKKYVCADQRDRVNT